MGVSGSPLSACLEDPKLRRVEVPEATGSPWEPLVPATPAGIHHLKAQLARLLLLAKAHLHLLSIMCKHPHYKALQSGACERLQKAALAATITEGRTAHLKATCLAATC